MWIGNTDVPRAGLDQRGNQLVTLQRHVVQAIDRPLGCQRISQRHRGHDRAMHGV